MTTQGGRFGGLWLILALACGPAAAQVRYHVATNGNDAADGLTWATALKTIPAALAKAGDGDTVMLSNGVFAITAQLEITNHITVTSTNGAAFTTVDAGGVSGRRVFHMTAAGAVIEHITIARGNAQSGSVPASVGGGVYMTNGLVRHCVFTNNIAYNYGAGVYLTGGTVSNCTMVGGSAGYHGGSGAYLTGGLVTDCDIRNNTAARAAGGVHMTGGTVRNSTIRNNTSGWSGGGIKIEGGTVENCVMTGNAGGHYPAGTGGGGAYLIAGTLQFCTVAGNRSLNRGGGVFASGGTVRNCIVYDNLLPDSGLPESLSYTAATVTYSCAPELTNGTGNIPANPEFIAASTGDYRLRPGSPCIDTAVTVAGVADDRDSAVRPKDGNGDGAAAPDMGAFEAAAAGEGGFRSHFVAATNVADYSLNAVLTAHVHGTATNGLYYRWDLDGNGSIDEEGSDKRIVSRVYGPGLYSIELIVSNSLGEVTNAFRADYIRVRTSPVYVATNGLHAIPFDSWGNAATTIQDAVAMTAVGGTVLASGGVYRTAAQINLSQPITVLGVDGAGSTVVERLGAGLTRLFGLSHPDARLDGFTVRNGSAPALGDSGGGLFVAAGTVANCVLTNNTAVYGGGLYLTGGIVTNCTLIKNPTKSGGGGSGRGGGAYVTGGLIVDSLIVLNTSVRAGAGVCMTGGTLARCRITDNTSGHGGGGVAMEGGGRLENCLILRNTAGSNYSGGGVFMDNAACRVIHCTIAENVVQGTGTGGGLFRSGGTVTNTVVWFNTLSGGGSSDINTGGSLPSFNHCCSPDLVHDPAGTGSITSDPLFKDRPNGDYTLGVGSPCIDAGTNLAEVAIDLDGAVRPTDGTDDGNAISDIGAYEAPEPGAGPLSVNFTADVQAGPLSLLVAFEAVASGSDTNDLYYWWDYDGDSSPDAEGYGLEAPSHFYAGPGLYTVSLTVSNVSGETATETKPGYIRVYAAETYVATNGANLPPYTNWVTAASNIQDAVDAVMDGGLVLIGEGVYGLSNEVALLRGVTVRGWGGRTNTVIERLGGYTTRLFSLSHSNAVLDELTLRNGSAPGANDNGGGVYMSAGLIVNCIVTNCTAIYGAGVFMTGGAASNSLLAGNPTKAGGGGSGQGGGVYMSGGDVSWSAIRGNSSTRQGAGARLAGAGTLRYSVVERNTDAWGGSVNVTGNGRVENCLIMGNSGGSYLGGGGVHLDGAGARVLNCTVVGNTTTGDGGGVQRINGGVTNTIVFGNSATGVGQDISGTAGFGYSCSPDLTHDPSGTGNIDSDPGFVRMGTGTGLSHVPGNYRLTGYSACYNTGLPIAAMESAVDLDNHPRVRGGRIDMGCYELWLERGSVFLVR